MRPPRAERKSKDKKSKKSNREQLAAAAAADEEAAVVRIVREDEGNAATAVAPGGDEVDSPSSLVELGLIRAFLPERPPSDRGSAPH